MPRKDIQPKYFEEAKFSGSQGRVEQFNTKFAKKDAKLEQAKKDSEAKKAENAEKEAAAK